MLLGVSGACGGTTDRARLAVPRAHSAPDASASSGCAAHERAVCITRSADGHTVTLAVGWTLKVNLQAPASTWSLPSQSGAHLLRQIRAIRPRAGAVNVAYIALTRGRTELQALERPACPPTRVCPQYVVLWQVQIHVIGR